MIKRENNPRSKNAKSKQGMAKLVETIFESAKEMGGQQQHSKHNRLSKETKTLLKRLREKNSDINLTRIKYTEVHKTVRKKIDIKYPNEKMVELAIENRNSYNKNRGTVQTGKKQAIALTEQNKTNKSILINTIPS